MSAALGVTELQHVLVLSEEIERARAFYEAAVRRLRGLGVDFVGNEVPGGPRQLFFDDPDGLRVEVNAA